MPVGNERKVFMETKSEEVLSVLHFCIPIFPLVVSSIRFVVGFLKLTNRSLTNPNCHVEWKNSSQLFVTARLLFLSQCIKVYEQMATTDCYVPVLH